MAERKEIKERQKERAEDRLKGKTDRLKREKKRGDGERFTRLHGLSEPDKVDSPSRLSELNGFKKI